jgi:hypothetical protein
MTLKEKLCEPLGKFYIETSKELEAIADEYAIGFAEWFTNEKSEYSIMYGNQEKRFATFTKEYTAKELLEIYKKEKLQ